jgi:signal transduction histidine kinase
MSPAGPRAIIDDARRWSLRRRVGVSFAVLAVLLAVLAAVTLISLLDFTRRGQEVIDRWEPAVLTSQELLGDMVNQETGVRGYALSGREEFLQPYSQYGRKETKDLRTLTSHLRGHGAALRQLGAFQRAVDDWHARTATPLIALVRSKDSSAVRRVHDAAGKSRFDLVRARAATLSATVQALNRQAIAARHRTRGYFFVALSVTGLLIVMVALMLWRGLHRWVLRPVDWLAEQTREVADGDLNRRIVPAGPPEFRQLGSDVETMRRRIADELERAEAAREELVARSAELARSNDDLEQFAYIASHDLSEPLRKVSNFCQLLERQYGPDLDDKARQYIDFAVDGAKRMQALINDLLAFSRVGRSTEGFVPVDMAAMMARTLADLREEVTAAGAQIDYAGLPTVWGDQSLLAALLANLVGNSVKYHGAEPPRITVRAARTAQGWEFAVADNGIGIDARYAERIFAIFQRLHLRDEYGGTGIGLALCRKIVEFHGGRIWLDSTTAAQGATFRFTIPEGPRHDG